MQLLRRLIRDVVLPPPVVSRRAMVFPCGLSRSGTTLLATALDAHRDICLGYELIPPPLADAARVRMLLAAGLEAAGGDFSRAGSKARQAGEPEAGQWLARCHRAGATADEVEAVLAGLAKEDQGRLQSYHARVRAAARIVERVADRQGAKLAGFKFGGGRFREGLRSFPNGHFVLIMRDPRDIVASQRERGFTASLEQICAEWNLYLRNFEQFRHEHLPRSVLIRYEDLVQDPEPALRAVFSILPVPFDEAVLSFQHSDASVLSSRHPNVPNLKRGFFTDSVGRGQTQLSPAERARIESLCRDGMRSLRYLEPDGGGTVAAPAVASPAATENGAASAGDPHARSSALQYPLYDLSRAEIIAKTISFAARRKFNVDQYQRLLEPYATTHERLRMIDFAREKEIADRRILLIRHDVDHDHLNAIRIARWEADHGFRATYCLLHTAWYYGRLENGRYLHTRDLLDCAHHLLALGHEVNLHNNLVVVALKEGVDPFELLQAELDFFRAHDVPIAGTAGHGDELCRELGFRNKELFAETRDERFGGPRTVEFDTGRGINRVELGVRSMTEFGLEYEAYGIGRDVYHTESGGNMRVKHPPRVRPCFGRTDPTRGEVAVILTHPIWWDFPE